MSGKILEYKPMCGVVVSITVDTDTLSEEDEGQNIIDCVPPVCEGKNEELASLAKDISQGSAKAVKE